MPVILARRLRSGGDSRPARAKSSQDPISKITRAKWTRGMAQAVEHLLCKPEALVNIVLSMSVNNVHVFPLKLFLINKNHIEMRKEILKFFALFYNRL
jgi:hypothetical protein